MTDTPRKKRKRKTTKVKVKAELPLSLSLHSKNLYFLVKWKKVTFFFFVFVFWGVKWSKWLVKLKHSLWHAVIFLFRSLSNTSGYHRQLYHLISQYQSITRVLSFFLFSLFEFYFSVWLPGKFNQKFVYFYVVWFGIFSWLNFLGNQTGFRIFVCVIILCVYLLD